MHALLRAVVDDNCSMCQLPTTCDNHTKHPAPQDMTETNLINLRRTIYLTIMSSLDFEEAGHKLSKIVVPPGYEAEIPTMLIECCSQEKTFMRCVSCL